MLSSDSVVCYIRNDLYVTLERGEFERGGKPTGKNIEVTVLVFDSEGNQLEVIVNIMNNHIGLLSYNCSGVSELVEWKKALWVTTQVSSLAQPSLKQSEIYINVTIQ